jgi:hypothetical protein
VINVEVLQTVKKRNVVHIIERRKANWIDDTLRQICLLKHIIDGKKKRGT